MNNAAASNVIPMRDQDRPSQNPQSAQFERLLRECQNLVQERLCSSVSGMLDKVDDALWGLAEQTHDREMRDLYLQAKDRARNGRGTILDQFGKSLLQEMETRTRRDRGGRDEFSQYDLSSMELGLVNDDDLNETLKVNEMAAKLRRYCEEELHALDQRVGVLVGDANLQGNANPFSTHVFCTAFKQACKQVEPSLKIRIILLKLFDDYVLDDIRSIYKDLNALLIQRSILPKIRYGSRRNPAVGVRLPAQPGYNPGATLPGAVPVSALSQGMDGGYPGGDAAGYGGDPTMGGEQDFFAVLQTLLNRGYAPGTLGGSAFTGAAHLGAAPGMGMSGVAVPGMAPATGGTAGSVTVPGFPPIFNGGAATGAPLLGSLTRLQHGDTSVLGAGVTMNLAPSMNGAVNVLHELKTTSVGGGMDQMDGMTLDIVAMLFDQIFDDRKIPSALKALISRLQIPMLKVAVLDKKFFSKKSHPARRILDALGEFSLGLDEKFDAGAPLFGKIQDVIQRLLDNFENDIGIFDTLHEELQRVIADENRRGEEEAKQAARRIQEKERLEVAKVFAQNEIKRRAEQHRIPQAILRFLVEQWIKLLLVTYARHGKESEAWKSALQTMDLLIWSVNSKQSLEERRRLANLLPKLLKRLHMGLQMIGTEPDARKQFFAKLMRCHTKIISGALVHGPAVAAPVVAAQTTSRVLVDAIPTLTDMASVAPSHAAAPVVLHDATTNASRLEQRLPQAQIDTHPVKSTEIAMPATSERTVEPTFTTGSADTSPVAESPLPVAEVDEDIEPATTLPDFSAVTIKNPFGEGEIEVEEISLADIPGVSDLTPDVGSLAANSKGGDAYSQKAASLLVGVWVETRADDDSRSQARLAYISPLKGTYLFTNRQGGKVAEYSLYQLAREMRVGNLLVLDQVPLFDRAMGGLVGALRKKAPGN